MDPTPIFALAGAVVGAAISATITWLNGRKQADEGRDLLAAKTREVSRAELAARASEYVAATYNGVLALRDVAVAPIERKRAVERVEVWPRVDRVNRALVDIEINDSAALVRAAQSLDAAMVLLARKATASVHDLDGWHATRAEVIGDLPQKVKDAARAQLRDLKTH